MAIPPNQRYCQALIVAARALSATFALLLLLGGARLTAEPKAADGKGAATEKAAKGPMVELTVWLPTKKARHWVNDQEIKEAGTQRKLAAMPVKAGARHYLDLKVSWAPNNYTTITRVRKVEVLPGKPSRVDLRTRDEKLDPKDEIVVIYVPTPDDVVDHMARLADVGKGDVVFDLGCGDGRMVCRAVAKHGATRGVGIDIDPARIKDSRLTAKEYKVTDRVTFREGDVLKPIKDLSEATVVMLYMGDELGEQLSPLLRKALKPGARVVSHQFHLGDWKPEKSVTVQDKDGIDYELHLWVVGAKEKN
jgi:uncharacterized protein (TIGR03000 family)